MVTIPPYTTYGDWPMKTPEFTALDAEDTTHCLRYTNGIFWRSFPNKQLTFSHWFLMLGPNLFDLHDLERWSISQPQNDLRRFAAISPALKRRPKRAQNALFWGSATTCPRVWRSRCKRRRFLGNVDAPGPEGPRMASIRYWKELSERTHGSMVYDNIIYIYIYIYLFIM